MPALVPTTQRRQVRSTWSGHMIGFMMVPLLVVYMVRPETTREWFVIYALWLTQVGGTFFTLAASLGFLYVEGIACFVLALFFVWLPDYAPLMAGTLMSINILTHGLFFRRLAKEAADR